MGHPCARAERHTPDAVVVGGSAVPGSVATRLVVRGRRLGARHCAVHAARSSLCCTGSLIGRCAVPCIPTLGMESHRWAACSRGHSSQGSRSCSAREPSSSSSRWPAVTWRAHTYHARVPVLHASREMCYLTRETLRPTASRVHDARHDVHADTLQAPWLVRQGRATRERQSTPAQHASALMHARRHELMRDQ